MAWGTTSRQSRGYGRAWELTRARILERDSYLCQCSHCKAEGRTTLATEVDHIISKARAKRMGWTVERIEADANLQAINSACHKRKTTEENGGSWRPKPMIGLSGWPIEERKR